LQPYYPTIDDTFTIQMDAQVNSPVNGAQNSKSPMDMITFHDTGELRSEPAACGDSCERRYHSAIETITSPFTAGLLPENTTGEIRRCYVQVNACFFKSPSMQAADAFLLVYDTNDVASFRCVHRIKQYIDRVTSKEKKEVRAN